MPISAFQLEGFHWAKQRERERKLISQITSPRPIQSVQILEIIFHDK